MMSFRTTLSLFALGALACGPHPNPPTTPPPEPIKSASPVASAPAIATEAPCPKGSSAPDASRPAWFALEHSAPPNWPALAKSTGTVSASVALYAQPSAVRDAQDRLVVVWGSETALLSRRFNAGQWEDLLPIQASGLNGMPASPAVSRDRERRPLVYFAEKDRIRVLRLEGSSWVDISPRAAPPQRKYPSPPLSHPVPCPAVVTQPAPTSVALDLDGHPALAWAEPGPVNMRFVVHRYTGAAWVSHQLSGIGDVNPCTPHSLAVTLVMDPKGLPRVFVPEDRVIRGFSWNGSRFADFLSVVWPREVISTRDLRITFDETGSSWLASSERSLDGQKYVDRIRVSRFRGQTYEDLPQPKNRPLGGQILAFEGGAHPSLALYESLDGAPRIRMVSFENDAWKELTGEPQETLWAGTVGSVWPSVVFPAGKEPPVIVHRASALGDTAIVAQEWSRGSFRALGVDPQEQGALGEGIVEGQPASIAMRDGTIAVSWLNTNEKPRVSTRLWSGCAWKSLPDIEPSGPLPSWHRGPFVTLDSSNAPILGWSTTSINLSRYRNQAWETIAAPAPNSAQFGNSKYVYGLAMDAKDTLAVGFGGGNGSTMGLLQGEKWNLELTATLPPHAVPAVSVDGERRPLVATLFWKDRTTFMIYVRRHDAEHWVDITPWQSATTDTGGFPPESVTVAGGPDGRLAIGFRRNRAAVPTLAEWNGSAWTTLTDSESKAPADASAPGPGGNVSLVYDQAGRLVVAWSDRDSGEILVKRLESGHFVQLDGASAPPGISSTQGRSVDPVLTQADGRICVVWSDLAGGRGQVLLRCHDDVKSP